MLQEAFQAVARCAGPSGGGGFSGPTPTSQGAAPSSARQVANLPQQTGDTVADVKQLIETSDSHSALLRELLFETPENGGTSKVRAGAASDPLVTEVKAEIRQVWCLSMATSGD